MVVFAVDLHLNGIAAFVKGIGGDVEINSHGHLAACGIFKCGFVFDVGCALIRAVNHGKNHIFATCRVSNY